MNHKQLIAIAVVALVTVVGCEEPAVQSSLAASSRCRATHVEFAQSRYINAIGLVRWAKGAACTHR